MTNSPSSTKTTNHRLKLDRIDRKILSDLQDNGRMTNVDLAKRAGISAPPCLRRVRHLEEIGLIHGYYAKIDPVSMGYPVTVIAMVKLSSIGDTDLKKFEEKIETWPMVREAIMMTGETDYMLKVVARDWDDYQKFLTEQLVTTPGVMTVKSSLAVKVAKDRPGVPIQVD
jgi:DNA-binding Lrp family transcriptional regulator